MYSFKQFDVYNLKWSFFIYTIAVLPKWNEVFVPHISILVLKISDTPERNMMMIMVMMIIMFVEIWKTFFLDFLFSSCGLGSDRK